MSGSEYALIQAGLPVKQRPGRDSFPTSSRAVKLWIEALPLANSGATARLLYNGIKELNQLEVDPNQRMDILEQMRKPMAMVASSMERHVVNQPLPLPAQKRQIGTVIRDFHRTLADGYRICVADLCAPKGSVPFLRGRVVALALTRAMTHLSQLLAKCYLIYAETPPSIWQQMHQLIAFGCAQHLHDKAVTDPHLSGITLTAESVYIQSMLIAVANPYRLTQKEIVDLEGVALVWSAHCHVHYDGAGDGHFLIDPDSDSPPMVARGQSGAFWRLDAAGLVKHVQSNVNLCANPDAVVMARSRFGQSQGSLSAGVLSRLVSAWDFSGERIQPRLPAGYAMDAALGLHFAHQLVSEDRDFNEFVRELSGGGIELSDRERSAAWAQASGDSAKPLVLQARVLDQSLGGYRIVWDDAEALRARVGELICLATATEEEDDPRDWMLGVLRWLKGGSGNSLEGGVQLLTRRAEPVAVRVLRGIEGAQVIHRGFLLAPLVSGQDHSTLLVPSLVESEADLEILRLPDPMGMEERRLCTPLDEVRLLDNSGSYKQLAYGMRGQPIAAAEHSRSDLDQDALDEIFDQV